MGKATRFRQSRLAGPRRAYLRRRLQLNRGNEELSDEELSIALALYCASANAYYPYVAQCPEGWKQVVPQSQP
jgi:hypothetical protein